jgi:phosphatidylserine/phosphatidylglycerophosphate/cardiolipin synthase-like enzyme
MLLAIQRIFFFVLTAGVALACSSNATTSSDGTGAHGDDGGAPGDDSGSTSGDDGGTQGGDAGHHGTDGGATLPMTSNVKIIVEPSDGGSALVQVIQQAQKSVHMTMYLLTSSSVISALIAQKNAGHDVKVILNQTFPPNSASNSQAYSQLQSAGVDVHWSLPAFTYTHEKTVIIDGSVAWIMTMNATGSSPVDNREYLAVDSDANDVAEAEAIFEGDFNNTATSIKGNLVVAPTNARDKIVALIGLATSTIDMEAEELSDKGVVAALQSAGDRGVKIRIVLSDTANSPAVAPLKQHGAKLVSLSKPYIHAKSLVADGAAAYVGSENFSGGSLGYNRELGVVTNAASEVAKVTQATSTDFASGTPL